ncbi:MBL fold metallo-hydrolase [Georgenia yuyongxinii]|uniref:MBL fold metallo-hydrolase n=1 Tax=Georgenia yuyongxinii TaxID=2589797 RepID=A0A5B8C739_9MICO|nr:MBL fold metallo-hydrolase [Georgenia yuyongxinii]QDC24972.1 MBL fold metallo-hydrolase [Georgenia yuyongxinii]
MTTDNLGDVSVTWWGASAVAIEFDSYRAIIDPVLVPDAGDCFDYVLVTREDHDHCHEPTLRRIVAGDRFTRMLAASGCAQASRLDVPSLGDGDLGFVEPAALTLMHPKYTRRGGAAASGAVVEVSLPGFRVEATESNEHDSLTLLGSRAWGKRYLPADGTPWPAGRGPLAPFGALPPLGFVVTAENGFSVWHPGDLQIGYDALYRLAGRVDLMLWPLNPMLGAELPVMEIVRPRMVLPIHYRPASQSPPAVAEGLRFTDPFSGRPHDGAGMAAYREEIRSLIAHGWSASPRDAEQRIDDLRPAIHDLGAELLTPLPGEPVRLQTRTIEPAMGAAR